MQSGIQANSFPDERPITHWPNSSCWFEASCLLSVLGWTESLISSCWLCLLLSVGSRMARTPNLLTCAYNVLFKSCALPPTLDTRLKHILTWILVHCAGPWTIWCWSIICEPIYNKVQTSIVVQYKYRLRFWHKYVNFIRDSFHTNWHHVRI